MCKLKLLWFPFSFFLLVQTSKERTHWFWTSWYLSFYLNSDTSGPPAAELAESIKPRRCKRVAVTWGGKFYSRSIRNLLGCSEWGWIWFCVPIWRDPRSQERQSLRGSGRCSTGVQGSPLTTHGLDTEFYKLALLYALPLLSLIPIQCEGLETFHRVDLRLSLAVPRYSGNTAVFVDARKSPLQLQAEMRTLRHIERFRSSLL